MNILKIFWILTLFLLAGSIKIAAQDGKTQREKIEQAKYNFIGQKLQLSEEQEVKLWPVYNDYSDKKKSIKKAIRKLKSDEFTNAATDEELKNDITKLFELKQQDLNLEKEYYEKFLKIISPRQTVALIKAEREFVKMLYKKLDDN